MTQLVLALMLVVATAAVTTPSLPAGAERPDAGVLNTRSKVPRAAPAATGAVPSSPGRLLTPRGLLFGVDGNLYVSGYDNDAVLRYDGKTGAFLDVFIPPGRGGLRGPAGLTIGPDANLYVSSAKTDSVVRYDARTGALIDVFVPRGRGGLRGAGGLTFGPDGNLYVSSSGTNAVLRYDGRTGAFIDAFVAPGGGGLQKPGGLAFGPGGDLYVCSSYALLRFDGKTGRLTHRAPLVFPIAGVLVAPDGSLYVTSSDYGGSVLRFNGATGTFLGYLLKDPGGLFRPDGLAFGPDRNLYISGSGNNAVLRYDAKTGAFMGVFASPARGGLFRPRGLAYGPDRNLYVSSGQTNEVLRYSGNTGDFVGAFVPAGRGGLRHPIGLAFGPDGNLYVMSREFDAAGAGVLRYDGKSGRFLGAFVRGGWRDRIDCRMPSVNFYLNVPRRPRLPGIDCGFLPWGMAFGPDGNLYISGGAPGGQVLRYDGRTGAFVDAFVPDRRGGLGGPTELTFGKDGHLYAVGLGGVYRYNGRTGAFIDVFVPWRHSGRPWAAAFGPDGNLYVGGDSVGVLRYNGRTGAFMDAFVPEGRGGLRSAMALVFGPDGIFYVADEDSNAVLRFNAKTGGFIDAFVSFVPVLTVPRQSMRGPTGSGPVACPSRMISSNARRNGAGQSSLRELSNVTRRASIDSAYRFKVMMTRCPA